MGLTPGARLGPYEIIAAIGAGGMGEVYRARDARLGRDVAIKVLPAAFSADAERLSRFEQEARAAATLNHPNILAVFDIGEAPNPESPVPNPEKILYVVSELLEGETLRERLAGGPLPVRKAIDYGIQVARGLATAHEKGIVHRDLKPDNIFLTSDGRAKILDFGLAKLTLPDGAVGGTSNLPTTPVHTQHGMVLGTLGYMAPEQVRGLPADHRADIFAFGAVLYEMLSGQRAFRGDTTADTMTAILKEDPPDLPVAERHIPPALARIIDRCLDKTPSARFSSAADLAFALDAFSAHSGATAVTAVVTAAVPSKRPSRERLAWIGLAVFASAFAASAPVALARWRERPVLAASVRFSIPAPTSGGFSGVPYVSPDGRWVAFVAAADNGPNLIWVRSLDSLESRPLPGTDNAILPFWSPDSRSLAFFSDGKLRRIDLAGGAAQTLCPVAGTVRNGAWSRDGVILFSQVNSALMRVSSSGGDPTPVTVLDPGRKDVGHMSPYFLPDGRRFVFIAQPSNTVLMGSLDSTDVKPLLHAESKVVYAPPGYLLFLRQGTLLAQPFDASRGDLSGEVVPLAEHVFFSTSTGAVALSVSDNGILSYRTGAQPPLQVTMLDRSGKTVAQVGQPGDYRDIDMSPDGTRLIVHKHEDPAGGGLWLLDQASHATSRFTFDGSHDVAAHWSPDGDRVAFMSDRDGGIESIYQRIASGAGADEAVLKAGEAVGLSDWSLDGKWMVFQKFDPKLLSDIWVLSLADRKSTPFLQTPAAEGQGRLSPDGKWMAYVSNETGRNEVYVQPFPPSGGKWQVSPNGGSQPRWRRDGKELFFLTPQGPNIVMSAVDAQASGAAFHVGVPTPLFSVRVTSGQSAPTGQISQNTISQTYAVTGDGQRFAVLMAVPDAQPVSITVVTNWTNLLKK